jgi:methyl-accepting chemotaxis protein/hemerythrin
VDQAAEEITTSTEVATRSGGYMDNIVEIVESTSTQVDSIATASEEQSQVSEEINRAVMDVTEVAKQTASDMGRANQALIEISGLVENLDNVIQGLATGKMTSAVGDALVSWSDDLSVGIRQIDDQHKVLVNLINELYGAMRSRKSDTIMLDIVDRMADYAAKHFKTEEDLFDKYGYPEADSHKKVHQNFVDKVTEFRQGLESGASRVTMEVMRFLKDWLIKHIQGTDKRYAPFLKEKGVK